MLFNDWHLSPKSDKFYPVSKCLVEDLKLFKNLASFAIFCLTVGIKEDLQVSFKKKHVSSSRNIGFSITTKQEALITSLLVNSIKDEFSKITLDYLIENGCSSTIFSGLNLYVSNGFEYLYDTILNDYFDEDSKPLSNINDLSVDLLRFIISFTEDI